MNADIGAVASAPLISGDSNPGKISFTPGGVGRNIAHNLALMGADVRLLSACGDDANGKMLLDSCAAAGINTENVLVVPDMPTSCYLYIAGPSGDMVLAVNDMDICERISPAYLMRHKDLINSAAAVVMDANLSPETIGWLAENCTVPIYCDPVSVNKASKLLPYLGSIHTLKPNRIEAALLSGIEINTPEDLRAAAESLLEKGVKRVFISLSDKGVFVASEGESRLLPCVPGKTVNTTGCGDAFTAALVYAGINSLSPVRSARAGLKAAALTAASNKSVAPSISGSELLSNIDES